MINNKMFISTDLVYNYLVDLKKKEINPVQRAKILKEYMETCHLGVRAMSKELGMSPSTLQEWVNYNKMTEEEYQQHKENGLGDTAIRDLVTESRCKTKDLNLNTELKSIYQQLCKLANKPRYNNRTISIINKIDTKLRLIRLYIQLEDKRRTTQ